ncbi:MAG: DUF4910 domain-containing protein [Ignisphaera sp.]
MKIIDMVSTLANNFSIIEMKEVVATLAKFHRIQGSDELRYAAEYIYNTLRQLSTFDVRKHVFSYGESYGLHDPVAGWNLSKCEAEVIEPTHILLSSFLYTKNCAVAHSPPGTVEGEVIYVGKGDNESLLNEDKVRNKIVLSYGNPYIVYTRFSKAGAIGFLFYKRGINDSATPYLSLFLTPAEASNYTAPAVAIPRKNANKILSYLERGEKVVVRIDVESKFVSNADIVVVEASLNDNDYAEEMHIFAHYCHPSHEINDNVSGAATLIETVLSLDRLISKGYIKHIAKKGISFLWFPEYYGTLPFLMKRVLDEKKYISFGINLDMIGEKQEITKSTLNLVLPPYFISNPVYESLITKILIDVLSTNNPSFNKVANIIRYRFDILPYEGGSDHDIYLQFSIPSVMLNQWPDIYYHTDEDDIHKLDFEIAKAIGTSIGVFSWIVLADLPKESFLDAYKSFRNGYSRLKLCDTNSNLQVESFGDNHNEKYVYVGPKGVLSLRYIMRRLHNKLEEIMKLTEDDFTNFLLTRYIPLLLMIKPRTIDEIREGIWNEYCKDVDPRTLWKIINILKELNLVKPI